jgi:hypothetical protein
VPNEAPYKIEQVGDKFNVVNNSGAIKSSFPTEAAARDYQKALYANVPGAASEANHKKFTGKQKVAASNTGLGKIIRLAGGASTDLAIQGGDDTDQAPTTGLMQTTAAGLIPGMIVSHPQVANGKPFQVLNHAHRGTHVEIIGKHPANGRGVLTRLPPGASLWVHSLGNQSIGEPDQPKNTSISNGVMPGNQEWSGPAMGGNTI